MSEAKLKVLQEYVRRLGLKTTRQREAIALLLFKNSGHMKAEEILEKARALDPRVSLATVYRTLKLLQDCGLVRAHHFGDGQACFEPITEVHEHHDHLICTRCGKIIEFYSEPIERLQESIAKQHGFEVTDHRLELYGLCKKCKK